ncbi:MAG: LicD family protein [Prevotella sp.]|nr:LicD family protein [Prevotella sp.]
MTEIERIINKGIVTSDFLKEEVRCGYTVSVQNKELWAIELDLLHEFDRVCKKYGLKYFFVYGSLLGAVRHQGFIPWDDDMDVALFRKDFNKLTEVAEKEFCHPYFFQNAHTDPGSCFSMARLRNSETTAIIEAFRYEKFNQGIVLDIFPIDNVNLSVQDERATRIKEYTMNGSAFMRRNNPNLTDHDKYILKNFKGIDPIQNYDELQDLCSEFNDIETEYVGTRNVTTYPWQKMVFKKEDFSSVKWAEFENTKVPIPCGYDRILKTTYGDYMKFPPISERGTWHTKTTFYDPEKSFKDYLY